MKVIKPRQPTLGDALIASGKPLKPQRPMFHPKTGQPPTMQYRKHHPTLTSPAVKATIPVRGTVGANQHELGAYLKALSGGQ
jgi:hypothetical protein